MPHGTEDDYTTDLAASSRSSYPILCITLDPSMHCVNFSLRTFRFRTCGTCVRCDPPTSWRSRPSLTFYNPTPTPTPTSSSPIPHPQAAWKAKLPTSLKPPPHRHHVRVMVVQVAQVYFLLPRRRRLLQSNPFPCNTWQKMRGFERPQLQRCD